MLYPIDLMVEGNQPLNQVQFFMHFRPPISSWWINSNVLSTAVRDGKTGHVTEIVQWHSRDMEIQSEFANTWLPSGIWLRLYGSFPSAWSKVWPWILIWAYV